MPIHNGIIYRGDQAIIPISMYREMLAKIHASNSGMKATYRWQKILFTGLECSLQFRIFVRIVENQLSLEERTLEQPIPQYPWQFVSQDLLEFESSTYLVTVDHYSDFIELDELDNTLSSTVIKFQNQFVHGMVFQKYSSQTMDPNLSVPSLQCSVTCMV